jgi:pimeloyl-ACP methyl ester carboxylesterase
MDGQYAALPVGQTHYELTGPADEQLVVLLPGISLQQYVWDDTVPSLAAAGYQVLRYDLLGLGLSAKPHITYDAKAFSQQLIELLAYLKLEQPFHVIGIAFGGLVAAQFAEKFPGRVKSATFVTPDGFGTSMSLGAKIAQMPLIGALVTGLFGDRIMLRRLDNFSVDPAIVIRMKQQLKPQLCMPGFKQALLSSMRHMPINGAADVYKNLLIPSLVVWGSDDQITPIVRMHAVRNALPNARFEVIQHVGHLPQCEAPEQFNMILIHFFNTAI